MSTEGARALEDVMKSNAKGGSAEAGKSPALSPARKALLKKLYPHCDPADAETHLRMLKDLDDKE